MEERFKNFTVLITTLHRSIRKIKTEEMAEFHLKSTHVSCLYYLYKERSLTAVELCDMCEEDKANISRSLDYLEKNGYLECASSAQKRYRSPLQLTDRGREVACLIAEKIDRILAAAGEGLSEEKRAMMYEGLALVDRNLQKICDDYARTEPQKEKKE